MQQRGRGLLDLEDNERRVLNEFRRSGQASKADVARSVSLTHPAVSRIVQKLCEIGYLQEQPEKRKGPRGQPATIYSLSDSNIFIGIHVGRRRLEFVGLELRGAVVARSAHNFGFLHRDKLEKASKGALARFLSVKQLRCRRIVGVGISTPFFWEGWRSILPHDAEDDQTWNSSIVTRLFDVPRNAHVFVENDGSSAALGELTFGTGANYGDFLYVNIGTFIGGGLVIDGTLRTGAHGNSGAIGPFPVAHSTLSRTAGQSLPFDQLLSRASLFALHDHAKRQGIELNLSKADPLTGVDQARVLEEWKEDCSSALAQFLVGVWSLIDIEAIVLDGALPKAILEAIVEDTQKKVQEFGIEGIVVCDIKLGELGPMAQSIGAACLPMLGALGPPPVKRVEKRT